jgi:hypothetical protein
MLLIQSASRTYLFSQHSALLLKTVNEFFGVGSMA